MKYRDKTVNHKPRTETWNRPCPHGLQTEDPHLDLGLPASRTWGQNISVASAPGLWDFLTAA